MTPYTHACKARPPTTVGLISLSVIVIVNVNVVVIVIVVVSQDVSEDVWPSQAAQQSNKNYECDDYTFEFENDYISVFANEVSEKTTIELDNALEENYMTVYVKTINGKTITIKCDKQKAATISDEVQRRSSISRGMTYLVHH